MKILIGKVVKKNSQKTIKIIFKKYKKNIKYKKYLNKSIFYNIHDEFNLSKIGDKIIFFVGKKISKSKFCKIIYILND